MEVGRFAGGSGGGNEESTKARELEVEPKAKREDAAAEAYCDFLQEHQEYDEEAVKELPDKGPPEPNHPEPFDVIIVDMLATTITSIPQRRRIVWVGQQRNRKIRHGSRSISRRRETHRQ